MKKLTSAIVASSLVLGLVGTAAADFSPAGVNEAAARMKALGVVKGVAQPDGSTDLMLNKPITRAELVTIIVRAFGKEDLAKLLKGSPAFSDSAQHWASGEIAMAKNIIESKGHTLGVTPTTFVPNKEVSSAEAIAFVMKFLGVKENSTLSWPMNFIQGAVDSGLITEVDKATLSVAPNSPAIRGLVFYLADHAFSSYKLADTGKSVYTSYVDTTAPVVSVDSFEATTEAQSVTLTGKVSGHKVLHVSTTAGNTSAAVEADLDGTWSATLDLKVGDNTVWIHAVDVAGNVAMAEGVTITRVAGAAAKVEATLSAQLLKAGEAADLAVKVFDANGVEIENADVDVTVEGEIGTYADGKFTAATVPATGKITVTAGEAPAVSLDLAVVAGDLATIAVEGAASAKVGQAVTFTAKGADAHGNEVALTGVTWSSTTGGVINPATGEFAGTASGNVTVTAKVGEISNTAAVAVYGDASALKISAESGLIANGKDTKTVTVKVADASGSTVVNNASDVTLSVTGAKVRIKDADGNAQSQLTVKAVNGVATFTIFQPTVLTDATSFDASTVTLSATAGTLTGDLATVTSVKPTVGKVVLTKTPDTAIAEVNGQITVSAKILDTTGAQMVAPAAFNVTLSTGVTTYGSLNNTTLAFAANASAPTQNATLTLTGLQGDVSVTGSTTAGYTIDGVAVSSKIAGPAYKLAIVTAPTDNNADSGKFTIKVAVQDGMGTTKTSDSATQVTATAKMTGENDITATATASAGIATLEFRPNTNTDVNRTANPLRTAGTWTFTIESGNLVKPDALTATVTPGAVAQFGSFTASPSVVVANGSQTSTLSVELQDAYGNAVPSASQDVTFSRTTNNSAVALPSTLTVKPVNGVASIVVTAGVNDNVTDTFKVSAKINDTTFVTGSKDQGNDVTATIQSLIVGQVAGMQFVPTTAAQAPVAQNETKKPGVIRTAGTAFDVAFNMVDANANAARHVSTDNGRSVTIEARKVSDDSVVATQTVTTTNGTAKASFTLEKATSFSTASGYYFKAITTINGAESTLSTKALESTVANVNQYDGRVVVKAAAPTSIVIAPALTNVETNTSFNVAVTAKDAYGNSVAGALTNFEFANATTNRITTANGVHTYTAIANAETVTLADTDAKATWTPTGGTAVDNLPVTAATINTYIAGPSYQLKLAETPANITAGGSATIKVGVYDGGNNLKTTSTDTITLVLPTSPANPAVVDNDQTGNNAITAQAVNGIATFTLTGANAMGNYTFEATSGNLVKATGISFAANAGSATQVVVDDVTLVANGSSVQVLSFKVADANGNTVASYSGTMKFTTSGTGAVLLSTTAPIVNGVASVQVKATTQSGTFTVTPAVEGVTSGLTYDPAAVTVVAGAPSSTASTVTITGTVYIVLRDANGNAITGFLTAGGTLAQADANGAAIANAGTFSEIGNGVYTATAAQGAAKVIVTLGTATFTK